VWAVEMEARRRATATMYLLQVRSPSMSMMHASQQADTKGLLTPDMQTCARAARASQSVYADGKTTAAARAADTAQAVTTPRPDLTAAVADEYTLAADAARAARAPQSVYADGKTSTISTSLMQR